mgnify:CR=1 FL=1
MELRSNLAFTASFVCSKKSSESSKVLASRLRLRQATLVPEREQKDLFDTASKIAESAQAAGKWLADKWKALEERYGRKAALTMAVASLATFPVPFNVTAIIGIAEGIRGIHGYFSKEFSGEERKTCLVDLVV